MHCGNMPDAREDLIRSVRGGRIKSRHSIRCLEGMRSRSHDLRAELECILPLLIVTIFQIKKKLQYVCK